MKIEMSYEPTREGLYSKTLIFDNVKYVMSQREIIKNYKV